MVKKCNEIHGTQCLNWNHEGQWILGKRRKLILSVLNSGSNCPIRPIDDGRINYTEISSILYSHWSQYWTNSMPVLVEKSPQSMLKIALMHRLFKDNFNLKFLIVVKHPVTLNIATMRNYEWLTNSAINPNKEISNGRKEIIQNLKYFVNTMIQNNSTNRGEKSCNVGWIPAMHLLLEELHSLKEIEDDIKILRYERFLEPYSTCKSLFHFIFNSSTASLPTGTTIGGSSSLDSNASYTKNAMKKVCDVYFSKQQPSAATIGSLATSYSSKTSYSNIDNKHRNHYVPRLHAHSKPIPRAQYVKSNKPSHHQRHLLSKETNFEIKHNSSKQFEVNSSVVQRASRSLRLKDLKDDGSFRFNADIVLRSVQKRLNDFNSALQMISAEKSLLDSIDDVHKLLLPFGYEIIRNKNDEIFSRTSSLSKWELN